MLWNTDAGTLELRHSQTLAVWQLSPKGCVNGKNLPTSAHENM